MGAMLRRIASWFWFIPPPPMPPPIPALPCPMPPYPPAMGAIILPWGAEFGFEASCFAFSPNVIIGAGLEAVASCSTVVFFAESARLRELLPLPIG